MSKLNSTHIFTSESVSEGHPDKVCDQISDAVLDACISNDSECHVACETGVGSDLVVNLGEITCKGWELVDTESIARAVVKDIGYDRSNEGFSADTFRYVSSLHAQSPDINQGVSRGSAESQGAGDQGMVFGYATTATEELMPMPIVLSHQLMRRLTAIRKSGDIPYLRPDAKSQVSVLNENGRPVKITAIILSTQTEDHVELSTIRKDIKDFIYTELGGTGLLTNDTVFHINPTGRFVIGGPCGDSGVTGRKIIVDTYGGVGAHGGGAFSGKDPSKVDRSAAYYARYVAKNLVKAGVAQKCEIQVAYAIGIAEPISINVAFFGSGSKVSEEKVSKMLLEGKVFDFRPGMLIQELQLKKPKGWTYRETANGGHFGRSIFPWEKTNKVEAIKDALGI